MRLPAAWIAAVAALAAACASQDPAPYDTVAMAHRGPVPTSTAPASTTTTAPASTTTPTSVPGATTSTTITVAAGDHLVTVARATGTALQTHRDPDGEPWWVLANPGPGLGERVVAVVDDSGSDWLEVAIPVRPNGTTGWVRRADVEVVTFSARIEVDLTDRRLLAWMDGDLVADTPVAIGAEDSPTPTGTFHVIHVEEFVDPDPVFGRWLVGTSGFSEVLPAIDGGAPAVAIHAAVDPSVLGDAVSLGCLRVPEEVAAVLAGLPLGTTVVISG